jgi:flavin reductase (DIM6/NTAB) family NADH-FMN oxidoreductase RutF
MIDAAAYRRVMGTFATGVTVVTTEVEGRLHGFTANAVTSVSLDPLLLLVCVDNRAHAHGELARARGFGVSILGEAQRDLSELFARRAEPTPATLRGVPFRRGASGVPLLQGALACLECASERAFEAGDHTLYLGRVVEGAVLGQAGPLVYYRGGYRALAPD